MQTQSINQFAQNAVPGQLDLQISKSGVLAGIVSPNQATPLVAGQTVKIDAAYSVPGMPAFVEAAPSDLAFGRIAFNVKAASFNAGDEIQVGCLLGPIIWLVADITITAGGIVDDAAAAPINVEPHGTTGGAKQRGIAIDPAAAGAFVRVAITNPTA